MDSFCCLHLNIWFGGLSRICIYGQKFIILLLCITMYYSVTTGKDKIELLFISPCLNRTENFCPFPSQGPVPIVVSFVQEFVPPQTLNMHPWDLGSQPRRAFANELLPLPVAPTTTIRGSGYSSHKTFKINTIRNNFLNMFLDKLLMRVR